MQRGRDLQSEMRAECKEDVRGPDADAQLSQVMILCPFFLMLASRFHPACNHSPPVEDAGNRKTRCFSTCVYFFFFPSCFSSLLSICPLVCLICFLPEGETIFWMSPVLINGCQRPPCSADSCSEWQIILCHRESQ